VFLEKHESGQAQLGEEVAVSLRRVRPVKGVPLSRLYFDSSIYGFIHECQKRNPYEAQAIRQWLRAKGWDLVASDEANLGEAIAIPSADERAERVRLILRLARWVKPPIDLVMTEEVFAEIA
jgi:hypothetical protein